MTTITTAARRIARRLNSLDSGHSGGFCVFGADGSGGYWYSDRSNPALDKDDVRFAVPNRKVTQHEIQKSLDRLRAMLIIEKLWADRDDREADELEEEEERLLAATDGKWRD